MGLRSAARLVKRAVLNGGYSTIAAKYGPDGFPIDAWTDGRYANWFASHRTSELELERQRNESFLYNPTFSIIVPLYKTPLDYLDDVVRSVLAQTYKNIELILVNASPEMEYLSAAVSEYVKADSRIKVVSLKKNLGITENTNEGLVACCGDFVGFLDHDDYIEPDLFYEYVVALNQDLQIDLLYCDEDMVTSDKEHVHPLFKPDYSPELMLSKNHIIHLMTIRKTILDAMPRPTAHFDGAQDFNMVLYASEHARKVHHVSKVLYHWRMSEESTAANPAAKPYAKRATRLAIANHLRRVGCPASIISSGIQNNYLLWFQPGDIYSVSILVSSSGNDDALNRFLEFFEQSNSYNNVDLIVASSSSNDVAYQGALVPRFVKVDADDTLFERFNKCAAISTADYLLFFDDSCVFSTAQPIEQLLGMCQRDGIGAVAPKTLYADMTNRCFGIAVTEQAIVPLYRGYPDDFPGYQCNLRAFQNCSALSVLGMMTPRALFEHVGGFDGRYEGEVGSVDYCQRLLQERYRMVQMPTVKLVTLDAFVQNRYSNGDDRSEFSETDIALFDQKWSGVRQMGDSFYNPNFDQNSSFCQLP